MDLRAQIENTLSETQLGDIGECIRGKVRDSYSLGDDRRLIVVTDRISAFDRVLGTIPFKGQLLNQLAGHWFELSSSVAPNHMLSVPDASGMLVVECQPLPVEFVVRSYLAGTTETSIWRAYERGERTFCGHTLADGMVKNQRLDEVILTPSTKAEKGGHDVSVSRAELIDRELVSVDDFEEAAAMALALFGFGQREAAKRGLVLVDTKYEIGRTRDGDLIVIDEVHTPDSSRYWYADDYEARLAEGAEPRSLDKDYVRRWLLTKHAYRGAGDPPPLTDEVRIEAAKRYIEIFEQITGRPFEPDTQEPNQRIRENLRSIL